MKKLSEKEIQRLLQSKFEDFKAPTPDNSWAKLNEALDTVGSQGAVLNYVKLGFAALVSIGLLFWYFQDTESGDLKVQNLTQSSPVEKEMSNSVTNEELVASRETESTIGSTPENQGKSSTSIVSNTDTGTPQINQNLGLILPEDEFTSSKEELNLVSNPKNPARTITKSEINRTDFGELASTRSGLLATISPYRFRAEQVPIDSNTVINKNSELFFDLSSFLLYDRLIPNQNDALFFENINSDLSLADRIGLKTKFGLVKPVSSLIDMELGVSYLLLQRNLTYNYQNAILDQVQNGQSNTTNENSGEKSAVHGLGISLGLQHKIGNKPYYQSIGLSMDVARMLSSKVIQVGDANREVFAEYQQFINLSYLTKRSLSDRYFLRIQPYLTYALSRTLPEAPIQMKPFGGGITIGLGRK